jgi:hypothetical protein
MDATAILIDTADIAQISKVIQKILQHKQLAQSSSDKGLECNKMFSWVKCTEEHGIFDR